MDLQITKPHMINFNIWWSIVSSQLLILLTLIVIRTKSANNGEAFHLYAPCHSFFQHLPIITDSP